MDSYSTVWERRPSFNDDGKRRRFVHSLEEAQLIMQMAYMTEPGFRPVGISDSSGHAFGFVLIDPVRSQQDYLDRDFEYYEEWDLQPGHDHWHRSAQSNARQNAAAE